MFLQLFNYPADQPLIVILWDKCQTSNAQGGHGDNGQAHPTARDRRAIPRLRRSAGRLEWKALESDSRS